MRKVGRTILIDDLQISDARPVLCALKAMTVQSFVVVADGKRELRGILADLQQVQQHLAIVDVVDLEDADLEP